MGCFNDSRCIDCCQHMLHFRRRLQLNRHFQFKYDDHAVRAYEASFGGVDSFDHNEEVIIISTLAIQGTSLLLVLILFRSCWGTQNPESTQRSAVVRPLLLILGMCLLACLLEYYIHFRIASFNSDIIILGNEELCLRINLCVFTATCWISSVYAALSDPWSRISVTPPFLRLISICVLIESAVQMLGCTNALVSGSFCVPDGALNLSMVWRLGAVAFIALFRQEGDKEPLYGPLLSPLVGSDVRPPRRALGIHNCGADFFVAVTVVRIADLLMSIVWPVSASASSGLCSLRGIFPSSIVACAAGYCAFSRAMPSKSKFESIRSHALMCVSFTSSVVVIVWQLSAKELSATSTVTAFACVALITSMIGTVVSLAGVRTYYFSSSKQGFDCQRRFAITIKSLLLASKLGLLASLDEVASSTTEAQWSMRRVVLLVVVAMSSISTLVTTSVPSLKLWGLQQAACGTDRGSLRALIACHILGVGTAATISVVVALVTENGTRYQVFDDALDMIPVLNMLVLSCMTNNDWLLH
jgi:hypothetical protein